MEQRTKILLALHSKRPNIRSKNTIKKSTAIRRGNTKTMGATREEQTRETTKLFNFFAD